jgi:hypothetical protein
MIAAGRTPGKNGQGGDSPPRHQVTKKARTGYGIENAMATKDTKKDRRTAKVAKNAKARTRGCTAI